MKNEADNVTGALHLSRGVNTSAPQFINGTCTLGTVRFRARAEKSDGTPLIFVLAPDFPGTKASLDGSTLPVTTGDGVLRVVVKTLVFLDPPVKTAHGFAFGLQPSLAVQEGGATDFSDSATLVALRIKAGTGTPGATLTCTDGLARKVAAGRAAFSGCKIDLKGEGYMLEAVAEGAGLVASQPFPVMWAGDSNGDCLVDIVDFSVLVRSFGKQFGQTGFDARADVNGDNHVDIMDFSILVTLFGSRCPTLAVAPLTAGAGAEVTVTGSAYLANRPVTLTLDGATQVTDPGMVVTDGSGGFSAKFTVPPGMAAGVHVVKAGQSSGRVMAAAMLTVQ